MHSLKGDCVFWVRHFYLQTTLGAMDTQEQIKNWSRLYGKPISETEYKEICDNLYGFFSVLHEWDSAEKKDMENRDGEHIPHKRPQ